MANTNRNKGHNAERHFSNEFKKMGYDKCQTSRYGSRMHDDCGIDLINVPMNVQIKAGKQKGMKPSKELHYIQERISEAFPENAPELERPSIVIHRKEGKKGRKRKEEDDMVHMSFEDFKKIISKKWI